MKNCNIPNSDWSDIYDRDPIEDIKSAVDIIKHAKPISLSRLNNEIYNAYMRDDAVPIKSLQRIVDYIKSWLYYPKMEKYFDDREMTIYSRWKYKKFARFKYAWWHCRVGKLKMR